ncbi:hypothetical protein M9H77_12439 [Catharanthus roseus]|uniref:Uncharacterized protein n=1 Tax=Catharanthus roseus TaxID=4058 RepID=A0ACC0BHG9_CATRO|nr:hypothetical protein M9H77_12439 [Catharanthus roseus]
MKKVQTIIRRYMVSIVGTLGCTLSQHDIRATFPVQPSRRRPREHVLDRGADASSASLGFTAFQSPNPSAYGFGKFSTPPPPGTAGALTSHQPISQASSSDEEEGQEALGRGHRVGTKTVRFTPSDWP